MAWEAPFDPWEILDLERGADLTAIRSTYHRLARLYHPNSIKGPGNGNPASTRYFYQINQAWNILREPDRRRRYKEFLELHDEHAAILQKVADLFQDQSDGFFEPSTSSGHHPVSSDADDDCEFPQIAGIRKRATFDQSHRKSTTSPSESAHMADWSMQAEGVTTSPVAASPASPWQGETGQPGRDHDADQDSSARRRKQFERLRRQEFEAFEKYRDAMVVKFEAEETAEMYKESFRQATWRREYFERAPKATTARLRLIQGITRATRAFKTNVPSRPRKRSTINLAAPLGPPSSETHDDRQLLSLPGRARTNSRRGWSNDISGDQTSSDEDSSGRATSPAPSPRLFPSPRARRHQRWDSVPFVVPLSFPSLPSHDAISPITGPGPKVFVRSPANMKEIFPFGEQEGDSDPSRTPSPSALPDTRDPAKFVIIPGASAGDILGSSNGRRSSSRGGERSVSPNGRLKAVNHVGLDESLFQIKDIGPVRTRHIPYENVHELTLHEKQVVGVGPDTDSAPSDLLQRLRILDPSVAERFIVKPDSKLQFRFRLIFSHHEVVKQQHRSFIALSYRRKLHVEQHQHHYTLPLEKEMFQAVWDERQSENEGVWIDQVCIDQDSDEEKTISMSAMDMVYRSARLVVVALDDITLEWSEGRLLQSHMEEYERQVRVRESKRFLRRQPPFLEAHPEIFQILQKLMGSSWFRRAWCRHEMRLAQEHVFLVPCTNTDPSSTTNVLRFTSKCLTHLLALATEVPFESQVEDIKAPLYAFFRDRSRYAADDQPFHTRHHGNFTTVIAEVFAMEAGGDPRIPPQQRQADARKDMISIILNTMEVGLALHPSTRDPHVDITLAECNYMLMLMALAARDPGALCSVGKPMHHVPAGARSSWLFEPTNIDSGLNNYRTLKRLASDLDVSTTTNQTGENVIQLDLKFLHPSRMAHSHEAPNMLAQAKSVSHIPETSSSLPRPGIMSRPKESPTMVSLAETLIDLCGQRKLGRNRKRYHIRDRSYSKLFGSMHEVYAETLACVLECGPDWMSDTCQRYGMSRWRYDLQPACELLVALKNTNGKWPQQAWNDQAIGFLVDFVNFLVIRGLPFRQLSHKEEWRPVWILTGLGGKVLTFIPPGEIRAAVPVALLDEHYTHCARLWVLEPRGEYREAVMPHHHEWTLLGKTVMFCDEKTIQALESERMVRSGQRVYGRAPRYA